MPKILFLYSELMPYMESVINHLHEVDKDDVMVIHWDHKKLTSHKPNLSKGIKVISRSSLDYKEGKEITLSFQPDLVYVSGWMDKLYLKLLTNLPCPVVTGMDNQWKGSQKQIFQILFQQLLFKKYFTHFWVPGRRQFTFARLIGYQNDQILPNLLTGNVDLFQKVMKFNAPKKRVIFLGRLEKVKGIDLLVKAWEEVKIIGFTNWELTIIGSGSHSKGLENKNGILLTGFIEQEQMLDLLSGDNIFCLPSRSEPWGVVVHEMAAAGMPLIISKAVGAGDSFLINNYNGVLLEEPSILSIKKALVKLMSLIYEEREVMGARSRQLSNNLTPTLAAASLKSIL